MKEKKEIDGGSRNSKEKHESWRQCRNTKRVSLKVNVFCFVAHNRCNKLKTDGQISERP